MEYDVHAIFVPEGILVVRVTLHVVEIKYGYTNMKMC